MPAATPGVSVTCGAEILLDRLGDFAHVAVRTDESHVTDVRSLRDHGVVRERADAFLRRPFGFCWHRACLSLG
jgi:hypothetical protein